MLLVRGARETPSWDPPDINGLFWLTNFPKLLQKGMCVKFVENRYRLPLEREKPYDGCLNIFWKTKRWKRILGTRLGDHVTVSGRIIYPSLMLIWIARFSCGSSPIKISLTDLHEECLLGALYSWYYHSLSDHRQNALMAWREHYHTPPLLLSGLISLTTQPSLVKRRRVV